MVSFPIVNFPFICVIIPAVPVYGVNKYLSINNDEIMSQRFLVVIKPSLRNIYFPEPYRISVIITILPFQTYFWQSNMKCLPFWRSWVQLLCFGIEEMCTGYDRHQMMKILHLAIRLRWAKNNKENCLSHSYHLWYQNTVYNIWLILKCYIYMYIGTDVRVTFHTDREVLNTLNIISK